MPEGQERIFPAEPSESPGLHQYQGAGGATFFNDVKVKGVKSAVSPEEITRLKGLGFLRDKNTPDCFNARVITRNGKVTADEMAVITEAARRFGSGGSDDDHPSDHGDPEDPL